MAAIKLTIFFFTLSPLLGAYHARHIHDGCIYQSLDQRPPGKRMAPEIIQMVTGEEEPQPPPQSSSPGDTIYPLDSPNAPPSEGETIYSSDNPKTPLSAKLPPSHGGQIVYEGDYLKAQPSPDEGGGGGGVKAAYSDQDNPKTPVPAKVALSHDQTVYGGDYLNAQPSSTPGGTGGIQAAYSRYSPKISVSAKVAPSHGQTVYNIDSLNAQPSPTQGGTGGGEAAYGRDNPTTPPIFASDIQIEQDEDDQTVLSIASHWLLSYTTRIFNNW